MTGSTADQLLKWGISNSSSDAHRSIAALGEDIQSGKRSDLADPELYQKLMGPSEAELMKEQLSVAANPQRDVVDRATALDNFEMLIESIDNANLMENMQMWPVFLKLLSDPADGIQIGATWIVGTAVQNNDKAQMVVLRHGFLHALLGLLEQSPSAAVRSKVAYALSGILKNNPAAIRALDDPSPSTSSGWASLTRALQDPSLQLRRKITFLMFNLLLQDVEPHEEEAELKAPSSNYSPVAPTPSKSSLTPASKSTALALTAHSSSPAPSADPSAPLERGPATSGISYPDVPLRLAKAGGIQVLASSLLPPGGVSSLPSGAYLSVKGAGPGADQQPRLDDDYAEKAVRVLALFSQNVSQRKSESVRAAIASTLFTKPLLTSAVTTLSEASPAGGDGPWHQALGIEPEDWLTFQRSVGNF